MSEAEIINLGWKLVKKYLHDGFQTNRYKLGTMEIEFTYEGLDLATSDLTLVTCDLTISDLNCIPVNFEQVKLLTEILGKHQK